MAVLNDIAGLPSESNYISHYYCDFIELLSLVSEDCITVSSVVNRFFNTGDSDDDSSGTDTAAIEDDANSSKVQGWFALLQVRSTRFSEFYPFKITDSNSIKLIDNLNAKNKEYLCYLLASLNSYTNELSNLSSFFEMASEKALKNYLPQNSNSYLFGKSKNNNTRYNGSYKSKVDLLAKDICRPTVYTEVMIEAGNNGDGGLDVVAWVPFLDDSCLFNTQLYLCQCATGKDWLNKQDSVTRISNLINLPKASHNVLFIPYDARSESGDFTQQISITSDIVLDRSRIMNLTSADMLDGDEFLFVQNIVDEVLNYFEPLI